MVSTCCISPAPTACFLKEVRSFGPPASSPSSLPRGEPSEDRAMAPGEVGGKGLRVPRVTPPSPFFGGAETGKEDPLPPHPGVKPGLLPLGGVREGQSHPKVRGGKRPFLRGDAGSPPPPQPPVCGRRSHRRVLIELRCENKHAAAARRREPRGSQTVSKPLLGAVKRGGERGS